ncbi:serine-rich adhesin for platelets-like [Pseudorasbora parva]|uniref:serine-rich adhesin for platelets-like n=1 Tax=Pseudorasbora parva TaxID=51549 RepID=UPI00351DC4AE
MDQGWKQIPLFVILLLLSNAYGFKVLSSGSEVPVTGILPKEMGLLKRLNLLQFVKGSFSSRHESTADSGSSSHQRADRQPANFQHPWKPFASTGSSGTQSGSSTPFNLQGSTAYGGSQQLQGTTSQYSSATQSSYPSLGLSSRLGAESQSVKAQSSHKFTFTGSSGTQSGSSTPFNLQGSTAYGGSRQLQGTTSQFPSGTQSSYLSGTPSSYLSSSQGADSQSAKVQYPWKQFTSTGSSGTQPGSSTPSNLQGSTASGGSRPLQGTTSQFASGLSAKVQYPWKQFTSTGSSGTQPWSSTPSNLQGSTASGGSRQLQGTTSQFASGLSAKVQYPWKQFTSTGSSGTQPGSSTPSNLQGSTASGGSRQLQGTTSQFASGLSAKVQYLLKQFTSTGSSGTQPGSSTPFNLQGRTASGGSWQLQGTTSQFASGSPSSYPSLALSSPQGADSQSAKVTYPWKQFTSTGSSGPQSGSSTPVNLQGSTASGGSLQFQGTTSQLATGSPSYPSVGLSSPQKAVRKSEAVRKSVAVQASQKQLTSTFTGSSGPQLGSSTPVNLQGSTASGSQQLKGTTSQFASGSPSSYPSLALSSPQEAVRKSVAVQNSQKQYTSSSGTPSGSSTPVNLQGSTASGSRQLKGTTSQFASGSPSSYPSLTLSSPQGADSQSAKVQYPWKQFTSTGSSGTQSGSSTPFNLQGRTASVGSWQLQGTTSQLATGSPSYPSVALSSPQKAVRKSVAVQSSQKPYTSSSATPSGSSTPFNLQSSTASGGSWQLQGTTSQFAFGSPSSYPSLALSSPQGADSQSAKVQYPLKQFPSTGSSGTQSRSSTPFNLQGSTASGSRQLKGTTSQFASASPSYPRVGLSPQGADSQSAKFTYPWKQFTSTGSSGPQSGSSTPVNLQGSTASGGSRQLQGTTSQFASGSPSSYPSLALSSPQGADSQSAKFTYPWKQFTSTGSSGPQSGSSSPVNLQGSTASGGSWQLQGTTSQLATGSPSYPSVALYSPQKAVHKSVAVQSSQKQYTSSSGTPSGSSTPFNLQGSTASGSQQLKGSTSQFASGSPSYPSLALSSPQEAVRKSVAVQSSQKQYTSSSGTPSGSSTPVNLQGSTASGSRQLKGTTSQFASGSPSSNPSLTLSSPQGADSQSAKVQYPWKQFTFTGSSGTQSGSSTPFNLQGSTAYGGSRQLQGTTSQLATGSPSYPSVALSSPQKAVHKSVAVQASQKQLTSTFTGSSGAQSGSSTPFDLQGSTASGGSRQFQGTTSQLATGSPSYPSVALSSPQKAVRKSEAVRKSVAVQASQKQLTSTFTGSSGPQSGSSTPVNLQGSTASGSRQLKGTTSQFASGSPSSYPSLTLSSPQGADSQSAKVQYPWKQFTSTGSSGTQSGSSTPFNLQGSTAYGGSRQLQGTTSQFATGSPSYPSVALSLPQKAVRKSVAVLSSQKQYTSSSGTPSGSSTPFNLQGSTTSGGLRQLQGTTSQFASGSPSSYPSLALSSPQGADSRSAKVQYPWKQFTSTGNSGTQSGSSTPFNLQGSTAYGGSRQLQGTTSQLATGSPSPSVALSSPQKAVRKSVAVQASQKQLTSTFTGSSGAQSGSSTPFNLQGSTTSGGIRQLQGTKSQLASGSPSYPIAGFEVRIGADSQSAKVQTSQKFTSTFTGSSGTPSGSSTPFNLQGSTASGSRQLQGTKSQFASGTPSSYPSLALSSSQGADSQSAKVQYPWKQFASTGSSGTQSGSSTPFNLQGSTASGSRQLKGTTSQFASGSPSSYPSLALSSPQGKKSPRLQPSQDLQASRAAASQFDYYYPAKGL